MVWIVFGVIFVFITVILYSCVIAGARADKNIKDIMKNVHRKE